MTFTRLAATLAVLITVLLMVPGVTGAVAYPFVDDVEGAPGGWVVNAPWARTTNDSHSPSTSWTDSPSAYYGNDVDASLTLSSAVNLSAATSPQLTFWHHYSLEAGFDFGYVQVATSTNSGPWTTIATYSGTVTSPYTAGAVAAKSGGGLPVSDAFLSTPGEPWVLEQLSLAGYAGQSTVWVRFRLVTDSTEVGDGWYVDDFAIAELPTAVTLSSNVTSTRSSLALGWTANADSDFASYNVFRSESSGVTFNDTLAASIGSKTTTTVTDTGLPSKTTFHYKMFVVNDSGVYSESNEVSATTLAGLGYPFFDDMDTSGANWSPQPSNVWTRVTVAGAHSGSNVWTDSPGADYGNSIDVSLVLSDGLSINPKSQLVFWHKLAIQAGDTARAEMSTDGGATWSELAAYTDTTVNTWTRVQLDMGATTTDALVRFRLTTDGSGVADGWTIDDVSVSDLPDAVVLETPAPQDAPNQDEMLLDWSTSTEVAFTAYEVYRSTAPGVTEASTLVTAIADRSTTGYTDSGLTPGVTFHYTVHVLNDFGVRSASNEASATTLLVGVVPYPFSDDMESGTGAWAAAGTWAHTTAFAHSTTTSWTDSPIGNYTNSSSTTQSYLGSWLCRTRLLQRASSTVLPPYWRPFGTTRGAKWWPYPTRCFSGMMK